MGHPVVTRLGINQFWYKHWCTDNKYSQLIKEDSIIDLYISLYLNHGVTFKTNPFVHEYWYKKSFKSLRLQKHSLSNLQAFRRYFYTNERLGIEHSYFIRYRTGEYFPMRHWVMRYGDWIFLSIQWFKPVKTKIRFKSRTTSKTSGSVAKTTVHSNSLKRLSLSKQFYDSMSYKSLEYTF